MVTATIGAWAFSVPDGSELGEVPAKGSYIDAPDGARGMYAYALTATPSGTTTADFASQVQQAAIESYSQPEDSSWRVVSERTGNLAGHSVCVADILNASAKYCIRFIVVCGPDEGLRLAVHDYLCESYEDTRAFFDSIEGSINVASSAA